MDKQYFPHEGGGANNKKTTNKIGYNLVPDQAIALDPRSIISEWTSEALHTMTFNEIYAGLQIYCIADRSLRTCRWVPEGVSYYTAEHCIWDILHQGDEEGWTDVRNYNPPMPQPSIDERISEESQKVWRFKISAGKGYYGVYNFESSDIEVELQDEATFNKVVNNMVMSVDDKTQPSGSIAAMSMKGTKTMSYTGVDIDNMKEQNFIIVVPSNYSIQTINIDGVDYEKSDILKLKEKVFECINTKTYYLEPFLYDIYVVNDKFGEDITVIPVVKVTYAS